jgi:hypothetical protein
MPQHRAKNEPVGGADLPLEFREDRVDLPKAKGK